MFKIFIVLVQYVSSETESRPRLRTMSFILQVLGDNLKYRLDKHLQRVNKVVD